MNLPIIINNFFFSFLFIIYEGHVIIITAMPSGNPNGRFIVSFREDGTKKEALHYNPRFNPDFVVVRNSMDDNLQFRLEERSGSFPFKLNQQFKLVFAFTESQFKFAVNGNYSGAYNYRTPNQLDVVNGFQIACSTGMTIEVTSVDHYNMGDPECNEFELYSDLNAHTY